MEAKIGNMTCVMRELNVLDASNNIDVQAMKRDIQKYTMPSEWFKNKYEHLLDTCYEMATNLPGDDGVLGNLSGQVGGHLVASVKELNVLDASNNIDVQAMKRDIQKYTMPSEWFKNKYKHLLDTCYEMATNLPAEIAENSVITGETFGTVKLGEVKMFSKCCEKAKMKLCMHQDIKKKVESNFGPMEGILQETQLTEHEFFPLVMQL